MVMDKKVWSVGLIEFVSSDSHLIHIASFNNFMYTFVDK